MNGLLTGGMSPYFAQDYSRRPSLLDALPFRGINPMSARPINRPTTGQGGAGNAGPWKVCPSCVGKGFPAGKVPDVQAMVNRMAQFQGGGAGAANINVGSYPA